MTLARLDVPRTAEDVVTALAEGWATPLVFDLMVSKMGWAKASEVWMRGCNEFDLAAEEAAE